MRKFDNTPNVLKRNKQSHAERGSCLCQSEYTYFSACMPAATTCACVCVCVFRCVTEGTETAGWGNRAEEYGPDKDILDNSALRGVRVAKSKRGANRGRSHDNLCPQIGPSHPTEQTEHRLSFTYGGRDSLRSNLDWTVSWKLYWDAGLRSSSSWWRRFTTWPVNTDDRCTFVSGKRCLTWWKTFLYWQTVSSFFEIFHIDWTVTSGMQLLKRIWIPCIRVYLFCVVFCNMFILVMKYTNEMWVQKIYFRIFKGVNILHIYRTHFFFHVNVRTIWSSF